MVSGTCRHKVDTRGWGLMKSIEQFLIEWLSKAGGFCYRGQFCLYSMKYALSSGNELWCKVVGKKAG